MAFKSLLVSGESSQKRQRMLSVGVSEAQLRFIASSAVPQGMGLSLPSHALLEVRLRVAGWWERVGSECLHGVLLLAGWLGQSRHRHRTYRDWGLRVI